MATLLSSVLVYNTVKTIDHQAIDSLELLAWQANLFSSRARVADRADEDADEDAAAADAEYSSPFVFPHLVWVVQDFAQELTPDVSTPSEWLHKLVHYIDPCDHMERVTGCRPWN